MVNCFNIYIQNPTNEQMNKWRKEGKAKEKYQENKKVRKAIIIIIIILIITIQKATEY